MILLQGTVRHKEASRIATRVNIIGVDSRFGAVHPEGTLEEVGFRDARINEFLAEELAAEAGNDLLVSFELLSDIPREHALGSRESAAERIKLTVSSVEKDSHAGIFELKLQQETPRNIFVSLKRLQDALERPGEVNSLVACRKKGAAFRPITCTRHGATGCTGTSNWRLDPFSFASAKRETWTACYTVQATKSRKAVSPIFSQ